MPQGTVSTPELGSTPALAASGVRERCISFAHDRPFHRLWRVQTPANEDTIWEEPSKIAPAKGEEKDSACRASAAWEAELAPGGEQVLMSHQPAGVSLTPASCRGGGASPVRASEAVAQFCCEQLEAPQ